MQVKVLGAGCANCHRLEQRTNQALEELDRTERAVLITDFMEIGRHGVMTVPALLVDDEVVIAGRVPDVSELVSILGHAGS